MDMKWSQSGLIAISQSNKMLNSHFEFLRLCYNRHSGIFMHGNSPSTLELFITRPLFSYASDSKGEEEISYDG